MELFNLIIIVPVREVFLLEILLALFPHNSYFINLLYLSVVFPPYGCSASQIEYSYPFFHISRVVLNLEILPHPKKPSLSLLTSLDLTIKSRRPCLFKFISWFFLIRSPPLIPTRWRAWISIGFFRIKWPTGRPFQSIPSVVGSPPGDMGPFTGISLVTNFSSFWISCLIPRVYLSLDVCQTLQYSCIYPILIFLSLKHPFIVFSATLQLHP